MFWEMGNQEINQRNTIQLVARYIVTYLLIYIYVCVCMCVYVYTVTPSTRTYLQHDFFTHTHIYIDTSICIYIHIYIHIYIYVIITFTTLAAFDAFKPRFFIIFVVSIPFRSATCDICAEQRQAQVEMHPVVVLQLSRGLWSHAVNCLGWATWPSQVYVSHTCLKPPEGPDFCLYSPERFTNASSDNDINHTSTMIWLSKYPIPKSQWTSHGPKSVPPSTSRLLGSSLDLCPSVRPQLSTTWGWQHLLEPGFWDDDYMITPLKINIFEGDWKPHTINDI